MVTREFWTATLCAIWMATGQLAAVAGAAPSLPGAAPAAAAPASGATATVGASLPATVAPARIPGTLPTNAPAAGPRAKIQFAQPIFDFGKVASGESVKHDFIFTNTGSAKLVLTAVQASCGCTAAGQWTREVEPGQTGLVPIQFNSATFNGPINKTITVVCNDSAQATVYLQFKGTVWRPIDLNPPFAILNVTPDSTAAFTTINVTNNMEEPVQVWDPKVSNPAFSIELRTNAPGKSYSLVVGISGALKPGSIQGSVTARTTATNTPVLTATAWANVQPPISLIPPTINLPQAPLAARTTPIITIINNTTNPLAISDPEVNAPGVEVKVNEVQPGRYYSIVLAFPPGFELTAGSPVEFKIKSNNPKYAELKVPVYQMPRPANAPPQATPQGAAAPPRTSMVPPASIAAPPPSIAMPRIGSAPTATPFVSPQPAPAQTASLTPPASIAAPPPNPAPAPVRNVLPRSLPPPPPPLPNANHAPLKTAESVTR